MFHSFFDSRSATCPQRLHPHGTNRETASSGVSCAHGVDQKGCSARGVVWQSGLLWPHAGFGAMVSTSGRGRTTRRVCRARQATSPPPPAHISRRRRCIAPEANSRPVTASRVLGRAVFNSALRLFIKLEHFGVTVCLTTLPRRLSPGRAAGAAWSLQPELLHGWHLVARGPRYAARLSSSVPALRRRARRTIPHILVFVVLILVPELLKLT